MADDKNRVDAWMPMWIGDYLADTMSLTRDLHGGYLLLLFAYWRNRGPLPDDDDDMAAIVRSNPAEWRKTLRPKLERFFTVADGAWSHSRADKELDAAGVRKEKAAAKAKAGAQARWGKTNKQCSKHAPSIAKALHEDCPSPSPSPIGTEDFKGSQGACDLADDSALGDEPPPPDAPPAPLDAVYERVIIAIPPSQAATVLGAHASPFKQTAESVIMAPCWVLMLAFDQAPDAPFDALAIETAPLARAFRNSTKPGRNGVETWTLHASSAWSLGHLESSPQEVAQILLAAFADLGGPQPSSWTTHR